MWTHVESALSKVRGNVWPRLSTLFRPDRELKTTVRMAAVGAIHFDTVYQVYRVGSREVGRDRVARMQYVVKGEKAYGHLFAVSREFQGMGEGRRQLLELETRLSNRGVKSITGHVYADKVGFYTACGFILDPRQSTYVKRTFECDTNSPDSAAVTPMT